MNLNLAKHFLGIIMFLTIVSACILSTSFAYAQGAPSFSIGAFGGFTSDMSSEAVEDYDDTEWEAGTAYGGSVMYRMANGFVLELIVKQFEMDAEENGDEIGTLKVTPILLMIGSSLRSYGSMRSRCILDGYEAFLTMRRSSPVRAVWKP